MSLDLRKIANKYHDKLKKIKIALFDIDGILTDGMIYWDGDDVGFNRSTHALDGYGLKILMNAGIKVGVVSGGDSIGVKKRFEENLKLDFVCLGEEDKRRFYLEILDKGYSDSEVLYMGDEFFDIPLLKRAGFAATVPHASLEVKEVVDYVTYRNGGDACAREVIDMLRYVQGISPLIQDF
jgi:3-deoxy-D-manno-octulosonate 8-phosphate phosphatase (KDO 8-P phosphatase)